MELLNSIVTWLPGFADALLVTMELTAMALPLAMLAGVLLVPLRISSRAVFQVPAYMYVEFLRNVPTFLLILVVYYGAPMLGSRLEGIYCGVIAIAIQHAAYFCETVRGGVLSVTPTQWDAGRAIGLRPMGVFSRVILPQAAIKMLPAVGNQVVVLIKDTSLVAGIGVVDLTLEGKLLMERTAASYEVFVVVAVLYLLLTTTTSLAFRWLELRFRWRH